MEKVRLGRSGLEVSRLGFGGLFVASFAAALEQGKEAVRAALDAGINYIDTAPGYGNSEEVLGHALEGETRPLILSTKLGGRPQPFDPKNREILMRSIDLSLKNLKRDHIDILMVHEPDRPGQYDWWTDFVKVEGPVLDLLDDLKRQGVIKAIGMGGTTCSELAHLCRSGKFDIVLTAFNYSLLWREALLEVLPAARKQNMGVIIGSPLQQGALARCYEESIDSPAAYWLSHARREQLKALYGFVAECGIPLPELALRFVISNPDVDCVLMGARSAEEVGKNKASINQGPLPADVLARLDEIAAGVPFRPWGEPFGIGHLLPDPSKYRGPGEA